MSRKLLAIAALGALVACSATAQPGVAAAQASPYAPQVRCEVRAHRAGDNVRLEAVAHAGDAAAGDYEFVITKNDGGGSSDIVQGGGFSMRAGETAVLGQVEVSLDRGGNYRARLTLRDAGGVMCGYRTPT